VRTPHDRLALAKEIPAVLSSSWVSATCRPEMSIGAFGDEGRQRPHQLGRTLEFFVGCARKAQVILRRAKAQEFGYEIVNIDLEGSSRIRKLAVDTAGKLRRHR